MIGPKNPRPTALVLSACARRLGHGSAGLEKRLSRMREDCAATMHDSQFAIEGQLPHRNMNQIAAPELLLHCDQRYQRHSILHA